MISSVSGVSFRGEAPKAQAPGAQRDIQDLINQPGKFTKTEDAPVAEKKKGGAMKKIGKVLLGAAIALGVVVGANKLGFKPQVLDETAGFAKKALNKVAGWCDTITKHTWDALVNVFKRNKGSDVADEIADAAADAAGAAS